MYFEKARRRIVARMIQADLAEYERGCRVVDFYMEIAMSDALPQPVRDDARRKLSAFALRDAGQTVADIDGKATQ